MRSESSQTDRFVSLSSPPTSLDGFHCVLRHVGRDLVCAWGVEKLFLRRAVVHGWVSHLAGRARVWAGGMGDWVLSILLHAGALICSSDTFEREREKKT